ncbi:E3 ubiquitin-protein ligase RNF170-like [Homalodisca vitripennis]|uniref:E3 ubiquitin-protein ligase RNF170-like n=1 Tax=Homalodisca vitripennis TaxID=197043 RepID=UPI001EEAE5AF|nr:E3 ubiquitin-protein ligase RNF170-like [Homalodisca vitripennis]KAG8317482.1 hypothetical protein J6590_026636 [Homalodisca vitripennis]
MEDFKSTHYSNAISRTLRIFSIEGVDGEVVVTFLVILLMVIVCLIKIVQYVQQSLETRTAMEGSLIVQPPQPSYNRSEEPCPICYHGPITFAVETDCYHLFCGTCMLGLIQYARHRNIICPVCRAEVLMLYPVFTGEEYSSERLSNNARTRDSLISEIQEYNRLFSGGNRTLLQTIFELPVFVRRLWRSFNNPDDILVQNRMKTLLYVILLLVALYILFPFDLFPEVYFGLFGFLDDLLVITVSLFYLTSVYRSLFFNLEHND